VARRALLMLLCCAAALAPATGTAAAGERAPRIVNPDPDTRAIPYQAAIVAGDLRPRDVFCGGTVVDALHVVTAGHCFAQENAGVRAGDINVIAGFTNLDAPEPTRQQRSVLRIARHPSFFIDDGLGGYHFDATVLTLAQPLELGGAVQALPLAPIGAGATGDSALVSGWGDTDPSTPGWQQPTTLQHAVIDVLADSRCQAPYGASYDASQMLCALRDGPPTKDSCVGDSGGPLASLDGAGTPVALIGIVSYGATCADTTHPGVYTRVGSSAIRPFLDSARTPVPGSPSLDAIGPVGPGHVLSCFPGAWEGATAFAYGWLRDGQPIAGAADPTYTVAAGDAAHALACRVTGLNGTLSATADSSAVSVVRNEVVVLRDPPPPASRISRGRCTRTACTLTVRVTDAGLTVGEPRLRVTLRRLSGCARGSRGRSCRRTRVVAARRLPGTTTFALTLRRLAAARYQLSAVATDAGGNRQLRATRLAFSVRRK